MSNALIGSSEKLNGADRVREGADGKGSESPSRSTPLTSSEFPFGLIDQSLSSISRSFSELVITESFLAKESVRAVQRGEYGRLERIYRVNEHLRNHNDDENNQFGSMLMLIIIMMLMIISMMIMIMMNVNDEKMIMIIQFVNHSIIPFHHSLTHSTSQ